MSATSAVQEDAPPSNRPTVTMAIGFATPAIVALSATAALWVAGFATPLWMRAVIVGAWIVCLFCALDGLGYARRCTLGWPYKLLLVAAHCAAVGSVIWGPIAAVAAQRRENAEEIQRVKDRTEPWRKEVVSFHAAQRRFPTPREWAAMHPTFSRVTAESADEPNGFFYVVREANSYELSRYESRAVMVTFVFDPNEPGDGGFGWRIDDDSGGPAPLQPVTAMAGERELFERLASIPGRKR